MPPINIALVRRTKKVEAFELGWAAAAIQSQVQSEAFKLWGVDAGEIRAVPNEDTIPAGFLPVFIQDNIRYVNVAGFHITPQNGLPYANVLSDGNWSFTASHECLEMLIDPTGNRTIAGPSLMAGQGTVEYLVEVCDPLNSPSTAVRSGYVNVSDFYLPSFFGPASTPQAACSAYGHLTRPLQILRGGYLSWRDPATGQWYQGDCFTGGLRISAIALSNAGASLREKIDAGSRGHVHKARNCPCRRHAKAKTLAGSKLKEYKRVLGKR